MSTETINQQVPAGTWSVDPVHSGDPLRDHPQRHRDVPQRLRPVLGDADRRRGARSSRARVEVASDRHRRGAAEGPPAEPRTLRRRAATRRLKFSSTELERRRRRHASGSRASSSSAGETRRGRRDRQVRPSSAPTSAATERVGLSLATAVDRRDFGLDWNAELPSGGNVLEYEVAINVELEFVAEEA